MQKQVQIGSNRTGIDMSPLQSKMMESGSAQAAASQGDSSLRHEVSKDYVRAAGTVGSVPPPGTMRGAFKAVKDKVTGTHTEMLLNKIGERLAYERSGVRIYESFIAKCEAAAADGTLPSDLSLALVRRFRDEEARHFAMLAEITTDLGADPTAMTPDADVSALAAQGLMKVVQDPRTSVTQSLEAMLSIEMTDNAAWELLIRLARDMGMDDIADRFQLAMQEEVVHLGEVRRWYEAAVREEAGLTPEGRQDRMH